MSEKNRDEKKRWRSVTIAFRVSPEENQDLNMRVKLSGLTKQDYITSRLQERDVVVVGNPRVHKALKDQMKEILDKLTAISSERELNDELLETIKLVAKSVDGLKG